MTEIIMSEDGAVSFKGDEQEKFVQWFNIEIDRARDDGRSEVLNNILNAIRNLAK